MAARGPDRDLLARVALCAVCAREARGFGYCQGLRWDRHPYHRFCSRRCQDVGSAIAQRNNGMIDKTAREATLGKIQERVADQVPYLPLLTGSQVAIGVDGVKGLDKTLDASFKFRFTSLSK